MPSVINGWGYPEKQTQSNASELAQKNYAKISVSVSEVKPIENYTNVTLKIIVAIESNDELKGNSCAGYAELLNMLERTKQALLKKNVIDKKYQINDDVQYSIPDEQYFPFWTGEMVTNWKLPKMIQEGLDF